MDLELPTLMDLLACPRCDTALDNLSCSACQITFPLHDGVPWLVADPEACRTQWRNRWHMALASLQAQEEQARAALPEVAARGPASERLESIIRGCVAQQQSLRTLLGSLQLGIPANLETYLALKTRLPSRMGLHSYDANAHRDWAWGEAENAAALRGVTGLIAGQSPGRVLVLGAGAGRLAYDIHQALPDALTVAMDLNPMLTTLLRQLADGMSVEMTEFPLAPRRPSLSAITRRLEAPEPARPGFEVILADVTRPPFQAGTFDLVITPWLLDVIESPIGHMLAGLNRLLADGGSWIYQGSAAFTPVSPQDCGSLEELLVLAAASGFAVGDCREEILPYMTSPDSRHGRTESVVNFLATRTSSAATVTRYQSLPDWIAKGRGAIPLLPAFQNQAFATRMHAFIMSLIDGKRSLKDMALVMEEQKIMPRADAEAAIRGFLIKMYEEASSPAGL
ncbi:MAG: hypothetical protein R3E82_06825 [Pseudomonadales bacterium]